MPIILKRFSGNFFFQTFSVCRVLLFSFVDCAHLQYIAENSLFSCIVGFCLFAMKFSKKYNYFQRVFFRIFILILIIGCLPVNKPLAQVINPGMMEDTSRGEKLGKIYLEGYIDTYFGWYSGRSPGNDIPYFVNHNRNKELNINLAFLNLRYNSDRIRARLIPGFGTYMDANYSQQGTLGHLIEANIGYRIFPKRDIWIDAGILASPYTNESAISRDQLMYTRSLSAEMVPYYLTGARVYFPLGQKWKGYLYLLNGWQTIADNNRGKALGTQIEYRPNGRNLLNWNTFVGEEGGFDGQPRKLRILSDFYWVYNPEGKWSITSCLYVGAEHQHYRPRSSWGFWAQANIIARYSFGPRHSLSGRLEYFFDPDATIVYLPENSFRRFEFSVGSAGLCWNIRLSENALFRIEGRQMISPDKKILSSRGGRPTAFNTWLICGATISF